MVSENTQIGNMIGSNFVQGSQVYGNVIAGPGRSLENSRESISKFLMEFKGNIKDLNLSSEAEAEAEAEILTLEAQMQSPKPKASIIREGLSSIRSILEGVAGSIVATGLLKMLATIIV
ncbi:MAG: hypothetical protein F6K36_31050 [Symploca sp. SIO3C6]|nr:hypothetical protein [Symploca sp. SIO3C6]